MNRVLVDTGPLVAILTRNDQFHEVCTQSLKDRRLKPQLADAALVHLAGRENIEQVFTVDRRDFRVYRPAPNRSFRILPEDR